MKRNANTAAANTAVKTAPHTVEANTLPAITFEHDRITVAGFVFMAEYSVSAKTQDVYAFTTLRLGEVDLPVRIHVTPAMPVYKAALTAAKTPKAKRATKPADEAAAKPAAEPAKPVEPKAEKPAKPAAKATKPAKQAKPATKPAKPAAKAAAKAAKKPAKQAEPAAEPAKLVAAADPDAWIGTTITGNGWRIVFDDAAQRTRVIVDGKPSAKQKAAIEAAGFYWSATTKSWNKGLKRKAYRAAVALADTLTALK